MPDKRIHDLQPGDDIRILRPAARARVLAVKLSDATMIQRHGAKPGEPKALAMIVDFEYRDGPREGQRDYSFEHPETKVQLA